MRGENARLGVETTTRSDLTARSAMRDHPNRPQGKRAVLSEGWGGIPGWNISEKTASLNPAQSQYDYVNMSCCRARSRNAAFAATGRLFGSANTITLPKLIGDRWEWDQATS
jgi:hypothetical protein